MESWYWDISEIKASPSFKAGIDHATETRYRTEGAKFISTVGQQLKLRYITLASGTVYFHRFYMHHSFKEFHRYAIATACLFLAGKVEETPKKARDLFKQIQASGLITEQAMPTVFGDDPKESLMTLERILLKTIKFDLQVDHPYKFMLKYAKTFIGDRSKIEKVVQMGWTFINDSLCTTLCLQWEPEIIAIALTDLSCRITKYEITDWNGKAEGYKGKWWDQFVADVSLDLLESICHQVLDFYSTAAPSQQAKPSSAASSSAKPSTESSKRPAPPADSGQPTTKLSRTDPPAPAAQTTMTAPTLPPAVSNVNYPPPVSVAAHGYPPATYPAQMAGSSAVVSSAEGVMPGYAPLPPGYPPNYPAPPGHMVSLASQPPAVPYQQYYPPAPYYGQPPRAPAVPYPQAPSYPPYPPQRRSSSLKVVDVKPTSS